MSLTVRELDGEWREIFSGNHGAHEVTIPRCGPSN